MAIAFDAATDGGNATATSRTFSHTCTGSDRILFVGVVGDTTTDDVTGVTYGGVAMTLVDKITDLDTNRFLYLFVLVNPASGANNVVISASSSHFLAGGAASYTGAKQTGQPDASNTNLSAVSATTLTTSLTTVADNCWTVLLEQNFNGNFAPTAGTGATRRTFGAAFGLWGLFDSNGAITPAGSYSMQTNRSTTTSGATGHIMASFAPAVAATAPTITSSLSATGRVDTPFNYQATADGDTPITWSSSALPDGLSLDANTGVISGTPTTDGQTNVTLTATNAGGSDEETLVITINPAATGNIRRRRFLLLAN